MNPIFARIIAGALQASLVIFLDRMFKRVIPDPGAMVGPLPRTEARKPPVKED